MSDHNEIGYGRAPKTSRFKTGVSGNPSGKKKGTRNFRSELQDELASEVSIVVDGQNHRATKQRALAMALVGAAIAGDLRAIAIILSFCDLGSQASRDEGDDAPEKSDDFSAPI